MGMAFLVLSRKNTGTKKRAVFQNPLPTSSCRLTEGGSRIVRTSSPRGEAKMSITSDEVNFLVYRYLQESGKRLGFLSAGNPSAVCHMHNHPPVIRKPG